METNRDWVRCVQWRNKIEYTLFCFGPWQWFLQNLDFCKISLLYLLLQFPPVVLLVVQHAPFITAFLKWMINVISFCLYLVNEMRRNLIKITSHAIFRWFTSFDRFSQWCHLWFKFTASERSLAIQHFHIDHNAPCLPPPKILHNHLFPISLRDSYM